MEQASLGGTTKVWHASIGWLDHADTVHEGLYYLPHQQHEVGKAIWGNGV